MDRLTPARRNGRTGATSCGVERLEGRTYCAVHAFFRGGLLSIFGDSAGNHIAVGRNPAGAILLNGGAIGVRGLRPTEANTRQIRIYGLSGDDDVRLDETHGALPSATLYGGPGDDVLTGGSGADVLAGQTGNDFLFGQGGIDLLAGGAGDDALTGGTDNDQCLGQSGDDNFLWAPGDESDVNEGGSGVDTVVVNGAGASEAFAAAPTGGRVRFERTDSVPFSLDIGGVESLHLRANAGDDTFTAAAGLAGLIHLTIDGGVGNDTLIGSDGADDLLGRDGNDVIDGNAGDDLALLGDGDDVFRWDPGDGSDVVEGQNGADRLVFNGSNLAERIEIAPNGARVRLSRDVADVADVALDVNGVERVGVNALGGADKIVVGDLTATATTALDLELDGAAGTGVGDDAADSVTVNGTDGDDGLQIASFGRRVAIGGLFPFVNITGEDGFDALTVKTLGGNDVVDAANLAATNANQLLQLTLIGGAGNDILVGSQGVNAFVWNAGDGSDTIDGGDNPDTLIVNGSGLAEQFDVSANGNRGRLTADAGGAVVDVGGVEALTLTPLGGADTVTLRDLAGAPVRQINLNLAAALGGAAGDGAADSVVVNGTAGGDLIPVLGGGGAILINGNFANATGLPYFMLIRAVDAIDALRINGNGGDDRIEADTLTTDVTFSADGGAGHDVMKGSLGNDLLVGGDGNDTLIGGPGDDTLDGGPGDNVLVQD